MAQELKKVKAGAVVSGSLGAASQGVQAVSKLYEQHGIGGKLSKVSGHPALKNLSDQQDLVLAVLGGLVVFHGAHFKSLFLCAQLFVTFLFVRVKSSIMTIYEDINAISDDTKKDAGKALEKKDKKAQAEAATTVLKALDSKRIADASKEVLICFMACLLVLHGGLAQKVIVAHALVGSVSKRLETLVSFEGFDGLESWTALLVHLVLWSVFLPFSLVFPQLALILNTAAAGASLATRHGVFFLVKRDKIQQAAEDVLGSVKGLGAYAGLMAIGTFWQFWSLAAGSTLAWYLSLAYLPFIIAEAFLSAL